MNIIFTINGGLGKSVAATAVCKAIKNNYPDSKLIVISGYPEVFQNNKVVDFAYAFGQEQYFYTKYIQGQEVKIFANEPYLVTEHILCKEHLIETWCKMFGIQYNGELPEVSINEREFQFFRNKYASDKPIMVIQTNGGAPNQDVKYSWSRDIPSHIVNSVIEEYSAKYNIFHIRREDQPQYNKTIPVHDSFKGIAVLLALSRKRLLIDSFCQHTAAALQQRSTTLWVVNSPKVFGYKIHDNILPNPENNTPDLRFSFYNKYSIIGAPNEFPYQSERDIFNIDTIMTSINNQ